MLCVIALLNQVLERYSRRCWMSGKFPNLELEDVFYESVMYAFPYVHVFG